MCVCVCVCVCGLVKEHYILRMETDVPLTLGTYA